MTTETRRQTERRRRRMARMIERLQTLRRLEARALERRLDELWALCEWYGLGWQR